MRNPVERPRTAAALPTLAALATLTTLVIGACATDKTLPSDRPFDQTRYNPNPTLSEGRNAADLVATPTPSPSPTAAAPLFKFGVTCKDDATGQSFEQGQPGYEACLQRKQGQPRR